jgi:peptide/nickel transport system permease protein
MLHYIVKKIGYGILVLIGVVLVVFFLFNVLPVNSARLTLGQRADVASIEAIEKELGLHLPMHQRLLKYIGEISPLWIYELTPENQQRLNYTVLLNIGQMGLTWKTPYLGRSYQTRRLVSEILWEKIPSTFILATAAMILATAAGILMGIVSAIYHNRWIDNVTVGLSVLGISQPSYFSGIILALVFGYLLHDYTGLNHVGALFDLNDMGEEVILWHNLILPAIALGIRPIAIITQLMRSSMLDVLTQDYIRTAKAKGLPYRVVLFKHALRNAMNPVVTSISGWYASLIAGAYFIEIIFDFKGLGYETVKSLLNFDFPVTMGSVLFTAAIFVVINLIADILYGFFDPRVSVK